MTTIGNSAFWGCTGLTTINIPSSVTTIEDIAFHRSALTSVVIPNSVTTIGYEAFDGCSLTSISIPSSVTSIGFAAFSDCKNLESITVDGNNSVYDSRDNCNGIIEKSSNTLIQCCKNTTIPNGVIIIGKDVFANLNISSISIPEGVTNYQRKSFLEMYRSTGYYHPK